MRNNKGYVSGFDARTGSASDFPYHPEKGDSLRHLGKWFAEYTGNTGVWTQSPLTRATRLVYLARGIATIYFYGGHRRINNLFGETLFCFDC